jgi:putative N6-adenine-specific DNA methylase
VGRWFASIQPGLEPVLHKELASRGVRGEAQPGGVAFKAEIGAGAILAASLRSPSRLLCEVTRGRARTYDELAALVRKAPWGEFCVPRQPVDVSVSASASRLHHREAVGKKVEHAIADALRGPRRTARRVQGGPQRVHVRMDADLAIVSVDAGGELLHHRGWRRDAGKAPLRENLAACLLLLAEYDGREPLVDPLCGAGTLPIEAALLASGRSPFVGRRFAWQTWPAAASVKLPNPQGAPTGVILGIDKEASALEDARRNARRARVDVTWREANVAELGAPDGPGLVVANPPYGKRLGKDVSGVYAALGKRLRERFDGWRVTFLAPSAKLATTLDRRATQLTTFRNGGLLVGVYTLELR